MHQEGILEQLSRVNHYSHVDNWLPQRRYKGGGLKLVCVYGIHGSHESLAVLQQDPSFPFSFFLWVLLLEKISQMCRHHDFHYPNFKGPVHHASHFPFTANNMVSS